MGDGMESAGDVLCTPESEPDGWKKSFKALKEKFKKTSKSKTYCSHEESGFETFETALSRKTLHTAEEVNKSQDENEAYNFNHEHRGYAIMIIYKDSGINYRRYTDWDIKYMKELFHLLGFTEIKIFVDEPSGELFRKLKEYRSEMESDCDCFACVVSAHGVEVESSSSGNDEQHIQRTEHAIFTQVSKQETFYTRELLQLFNDDNCPQLKGKPKLFFIQACRGKFGSSNYDDVDHGVTLPTDDITRYDSPCTNVVNTLNTSSGPEDVTRNDAVNTNIVNTSNTTSGPDDVIKTNSLSTNVVKTSSTVCGEDDVTRNDAVGTNIVNTSNSSSNDVTRNDALDTSVVKTFGTISLPDARSFGTGNPAFPGKRPQTEVLEPIELFQIPCFVDYLVMFSSAQGTLAFSEYEKGGWLMWCLWKVCENISQYRDRSLLQILTKVCNRMTYEVSKCPSYPEYDQAKSAACIYHMLTKDIYFN